MEVKLEKMKIVSGNKMIEVMKKVLYTLIALSATCALTISCEKELESSNEEKSTDKVVNSNIPTEIIAVINPDDVATRTQYESNTTFGWTNGDQIRMPVAKWSGENASGNITACDYYTFTTSSASGSASASFTINGGSADLEGYDPNPSGAAASWTSMGYLVYPASLVDYKEYYDAKPKLTLPSSIAYNASNPLDDGVIPLIGRKDGETYKFSTAVGIIKLTVSNAPSAAKKIRLTSAANYLAGDFVPTDVSATVSQIQQPAVSYGERVLNLTGLSLTAGESYDFYFPVPVGTYAANDLSISVLDSNNVPLLEKTIAKELTIARNEVLSIPTLLYHRVYINGSPSNPGLYTVKPSSANTIRVHISNEKLTSANYNSSDWVDGNKFGSSQSGWSLTGLKNKSGNAFLSSEGQYYLQYIVSSDGSKPGALNDATVMIYGSVPFYYIPYSSPKRIPVASSWLDVPYVSTVEGAVANLVDGNTSTYWHSPYSGENPARNATYGQIISIDLNEGSLTTDGNFNFYFATRNVINNHAKELNVYVSNVRWDDAGFDAGKVLVGSTTNALEGIYPTTEVWIKNPIECSGSGSYRYITISILTDSNGHDLRTTECTHLAEIEFYTK